MGRFRIVESLKGGHTPPTHLMDDGCYSISCRTFLRGSIQRQLSEDFTYQLPDGEDKPG